MTHLGGNAGKTSKRAPGRFLSLQARITLSVGVATAVTLAAFGYIASWVVQESTATMLRNRLQVAEAVADRVAESLTGYWHELQDLGYKLSLEPAPSQQAVILRESGEPRRFAGLAVINPDGQVFWSRPTGWITATPGLSAMLLSASPGSAVALPPLKTMPGAHLTAFVQALKGSGHLLVGAVDLTKLRLVDAFRGNESPPLDFELMSPGGTVLASTDPMGIGRPSEHLPVIASLIRQGQPGIMLHTLPHHPHYVAYTPLREYPGWAVNVEQPRDTVLFLPHGLRNRLALLGIVIVAGMSLLAFLDVRSVVRPLARLREAAGHIAGGDLDHPVQEGRRDEVGALARTFETMRTTLKTSHEEIAAWNRELEARVADRTRKLNTLYEITQALSLLPLRTLQETAEDVVQRIAAATGGRCRVDLEPRTTAAPEPGETSNVAAPEGEDGHSAGEDSTGLTGMPLVLQGRRIGTLWLDAGAIGLTKGDPTMIRIIASQAAVALENAELYEEVRDRDALRRELLERIVLAQEEERRRIARELHDEIGQALTALVMQLGTVENAVPRSASPLRDRLAGIRGLTSQTVAEVRRLMLDLRPAILDDLGLVPAIRWYAESHLPPAGIEAQVSVSGLDEHQRFPRRLELVAFRLTQEALTNVLRHAGATRVTISLERQNGTLALSIGDNGRGFDAGRQRKPGQRGGWGLVGMQERVVLLGGALVVTSRPRQGTRVTATIPIGEEAEDG